VVAKRSGSTATCPGRSPLHRGPVLTVANFDGTWPGLVGLLNLNASMTRWKEYSTIWSTDFTDEWFRDGIKQWTETGKIVHDASHVRPLLPCLIRAPSSSLALPSQQAPHRQGHLGRIRRGVHGHVHAIIDDDCSMASGSTRRGFPQSALYAEMATVGEEETTAVRRWLSDRG